MTEENRTDGSDARRRFGDLLLYPREGLDIEHKGWVDLGDEEYRARIAKALIALTNHGGGYLILGYREDGGLWIPAEPRPSDLAAFDQDAINGIVDRYSQPLFHCETEHVLHPTIGLRFPVVRAPGNQRVPVRTKRGCPCGKHVQSNVYYIRRPGPRSEAPQTGREWDELIRRCVRAAREEMLDDFRAIVLGIQTGEPTPVLAPQPPTRTEVEEIRLREWITESRERFESLVKEKLKNEKPSRYSHGVCSFAYTIIGEFEQPSLSKLREILDSIEGRETGWPMWLVPSWDDLHPYAYEESLECWIVGTKFDDAGHSDFWRVSRSGLAYLIRGYQEDADPMSRVEPGSVLDVTLPIWRVGEGLLHAERFAEALGISSASVLFRVSWEGLENRRLVSLDPGRGDIRRNRTSHQDNVAAETTVPVERIGPSLPEIVTGLTRKLYESFDLFVPPATLVVEELAKMRKSATSRGGSYGR